MKKGVFYAVLAVSLTAAVFILPILNSRANRIYEDSSTSKVSKSSMVIVNSNSEKSNDDNPKVNTTSSYIVRLNGDSLIDAVLSNSSYNDVASLLLSSDSREYYDSIKKSQAIVKASIQKIIPDSDFTDSFTYSAIFNGFSVKIPDSEYDKLTKINGVRSVIKSTVEQSISAEEEDNKATIKKLSSTSTSLIQAESAYKKGLTGNDMLIAVLDDEFDCTHSAFSALPESQKYTEQQLSTIFNNSAFNVGSGSSFKDAYNGGKIVFAYDYADRDNETYCADNSHGTAVASLIAGNNGKTDDARFRGTAYNAQLALMKVAHDKDVSQGKITSLCAVLAAFDDSVKLGADIIHCSFGSPRGIENDTIYNEVVTAVENIGISVVTSAGNSAYNGSEFADKTVLSPKDIDYGTINDLGLLESALTVASADNPQKIEHKLTANDNSDISYVDIPSVDKNGNVDYSATTLAKKINTSEYIYIHEGAEQDYTDENVYGKIAVIEKTDDISLEQQVATAYSKGAIAVVIINGEETDNDYTVESAPLPMICVDSDNINYFQTYPNGSLTVDTTEYLNTTDTSLRMSPNSSYGVTSELELKPDITAVGGAVYSGINDDRYATVSGTSMAAATTSGAVAVLKNYLNQQSAFSSMTASEQKKTLNNLMLSNADVLTQNADSTDTLYVTPRLQGAGVVNLNRAISAEAYLTTGNGSAKVTMGENKEGIYEFSVTVHNLSAKEKKFNLSTALQTDAYEVDENGQFINTRTPYALNDGATVEFTADGKKTDSVTVDANAQKEITVRIALDSPTVLAYQRVFTNGFYVDGYLFLTESDGTVLNAPMLGYCGQLTAMDIFDKTQYDNSSAVSGLSNTLVAVSDDEKENAAYTLGYNHFTKQYDGDISIGTNTARNYNDNAKLGNTYILPNFYLMRDAYNYTVTVSDLNGNNLFSYNYGNIGHYRSSETAPYQQLIGKSAALQNFFATLGEGEYVYTVTASVRGADDSTENYSKSLHFTVDNTAPTHILSKTYSKDNRIYLELSAKDDKKLQGFQLYTAAYHSSTGKYDYADSLDNLMGAGLISNKAYVLNDIINNDDGSVTYLYDITELRNQLTRIGKYGVGTSVAPSTLKIAYKAVDYAFNTTSAYTVDTIMLGSATFHFVDQNGKPIEGLTVSLDGDKKTTDKDGKIVYDRLVPAMYSAEIVSVPDNYTYQDETYIVSISDTNLKYQSKTVLKFTGKYSTQNGESSVAESSDEESSEPEQSDIYKENRLDQNSYYALGFIGTLLVIGVIALIVSRQRKR